MSTASPSAERPLQTAPPPAATSHAGTVDSLVDGPAPPSRDETLEAARAFEKLLIHDMLKTMRRTAATLGEERSNARSTYDDMLDEHLAGGDERGRRSRARGDAGPAARSVARA